MNTQESGQDTPRLIDRTLEEHLLSILRNLPQYNSLVGSAIDEYHVLEFLAEGGIAEVYVACRKDDPGVHVALKVLKLGLDTCEVLAQFSLEQRLLRELESPHIPKFMGEGITPCGRAYVAMELIHGEAITAYCDRSRRDVPQRVRLFSETCQAVQEATDHGIVHRDLKPNNILVAEPTSGPTIRIIDFGMAKATIGDSSASEATTFGLHLLGTPAYMSPEQARGETDVRPPSDVYSLGVVLFELLTGTRPMVSTPGNDIGIDAWRFRLIEDDTPRASERVDMIDASRLSEICRARRTTPRKLKDQLQGSLDAILQRALAHDPADRFATPGALADAINAYLAGNSSGRIRPGWRRLIERWRGGHNIFWQNVVVPIGD